MIECFPPNSRALLFGPPGVGKFEFSMEFARTALQEGEKIVFVAVDSHPIEIRDSMRSFGIDVSACEGSRLLLVDCYSSSAEDVQSSSARSSALRVSSLSNIENLGMCIFKAADFLGKPVRIIFYTLSTLFHYNPPDAMAKFFQVVSSRVKTKYGFVLYVLHEGVHQDKTVRLLESLVDGVVQMRFDENLGREWRIHHYRGRRSDPHWVQFDVNKYAFITSVDKKILLNEFENYEYGLKMGTRKRSPAERKSKAEVALSQ